MALKSLNPGMMSLLGANPWTVHGIHVVVGDDYQISTDRSLWKIVVDGVDITKRCEILRDSMQFVVIKRIDGETINASWAQNGYKSPRLDLSVPVIKKDTTTTVQNKLTFKLCEHKKIQTNFINFNGISYDESLVTDFSTSTSSDLAYFNAIETNGCVEMLIYNDRIDDFNTVISILVPVCDKNDNLQYLNQVKTTNSLGVTSVKTLMGTIKQFKTLRVANSAETLFNVSFLDKDANQQLITIGDYKYAVARVKINFSEYIYADDYKVYVIFE